MKTLFVAAALLFLLSCNAKRTSSAAATTIDTSLQTGRAVAGTKDPCDAVPENLHRYYLDEVANLSNSIAKEKLVLSKAKRDIPPRIQCLLDKIGGGKFTTADSGEAWQCCCDRSDTTLPDHRLIAVAQSPRYFLITYNTGGFAVRSYLLIIHLDGDRQTEYWEQEAYGKDLNTIEGMLQVLAARR